MERLLMGLMLLLVTNTASAAWTYVGDTGYALHYVDTGSIQRIGNNRRMWDLFDYKAQQTKTRKPYFSSRSLMEYDCSNMKQRRLSIIVSSGKMGGGDTVFTNSEADPWKTIESNSAAIEFFKIACG